MGLYNGVSRDMGGDQGDVYYIPSSTTASCHPCLTLVQWYWTIITTGYILFLGSELYPGYTQIYPPAIKHGVYCPSLWRDDYQVLYLLYLLYLSYVLYWICLLLLLYISVLIILTYHIVNIYIYILFGFTTWLLFQSLAPGRWWRPCRTAKCTGESPMRGSPVSSCSNTKV